MLSHSLRAFSAVSKHQTFFDLAFIGGNAWIFIWMCCNFNPAVSPYEVWVSLRVGCWFARATEISPKRTQCGLQLSQESCIIHIKSQMEFLSSCNVVISLPYEIWCVTLQTPLHTFSLRHWRASVDHSCQCWCKKIPPSPCRLGLWDYGGFWRAGVKRNPEM